MTYSDADGAADESGNTLSAALRAVADAIVRPDAELAEYAETLRMLADLADDSADDVQ